MECVICFELISNEKAYSTFCGHIFCDCLISASLSSCPVCRQPLVHSQIHKIYLPEELNRSSGNTMEDAIVQSLATTVAAQQKKTEAKFQEISSALEGLQLTFSKSDSIYEAYRSENGLLKEEVEQLKAKIKSIEELLDKKDAFGQTGLRLLSFDEEGSFDKEVETLSNAFDTVFQDETVDDESVFQVGISEDESVFQKISTVSQDEA